jgi:hypothetical protein
MWSGSGILKERLPENLRGRKRELQKPDIEELWPEDPQNIPASVVVLSRQNQKQTLYSLIKSLSEKKSRIVGRVEF